MGSLGLGFSRLTAKRFLAATLLGALGFVINCYPLPLFSNVELVLGNATILLCASRLGTRHTLWCAFLTLSGLALTWGQTYVYLTYGLEALVVCQLRRRGWYLLYADFFYWCLLGMPLTALLILQFFDLPHDYQFFTVIKQGFNGLLYTAVASLISLLLPNGWFRPIRQQPNVLRTFREKLVHGVLVMLSLVFMLSMLVASRNMVATQQQLVATNLVERSAHLTHELRRHFEVHQRGVVLASRWFAQGVPKDHWQAKLEQLHQQYPGFLTMLVTDASGTITQASPGDLIRRVPPFSVAERAYFKVAMTERRPYVSELLQGKGFGSDPIVALSAPILGADGEPQGIVEGSLDLTQIGGHEEQTHWGDVNTVLVDARGRVVFASRALGLTPLTHFDYQSVREVKPNQLALLNLHSTNVSVGEYFYHRNDLDNGWRLYVLLPYRPLAERLEAYYLIGIGLLVLGMLVSMMLARHISRYLTAPLESLVRHLAVRQESEDPLGRLPRLPRGSAREIKTLYEELEANRIALREYQDSLEALVATRTAQLEAANRKLAQLAHRDGLTGAYNRRYFDQHFEVARQHCVRSGGQLALALIDIDHFKAVNDTHGHLVGDDCLKSLVDLIQGHFSRKLDLLARYGGEEFVLLLPQCAPDKVIRRLESLRSLVEATPMSESADGEPLYITISIGVMVDHADFSQHQPDWVMAADAELYRAKQGGRNQVRVAGAIPQQPLDAPQAG
ncbi:diguanylate cyclase [Ferrimonas balearica]|uniref:sensor domain-containing diguanylate cyclase n=1 Tax=Ferrimonas balearica TaxID=44012 RepID=UPI001C99CFFF|nr:diguanylate cyclase [Ferrimonas balearica]MBY5991253.1 diguanylate cyclase [Ferrimonas balearica]